MQGFLATTVDSSIGNPFEVAERIPPGLLQDGDVRLEEQALDERYPTDVGDDHRQRPTRPDIVRENHRQPSGQRDDTNDEDHRRVVEKRCHRLQSGLPASDHGERYENVARPKQPIVRGDMLPSEQIKKLSGNQSSIMAEVDSARNSCPVLPDYSALIPASTRARSVR